MILITTQNFPPDRGGIENLMGGLADNLARAGHKIAVYADRIRTAGLGERAGLSYDVVRFGGPRPLRRRLKAYAVARAVRDKGATAIFADSYKSIELLPPVGVPIAVLAHGMEFPANPSSAKRARIKRALAKAHAIIANSAYTAAQVKPYLDDGEVRLRVVNPPIGAQPDARTAALAGLREIVAGRSPVLLTLARLEPRKGVDMVIRALPQILQNHPKAVYVVAGDGDDRARLEQIAAEVGVTSHVHFTGPVDGATKAALFASADVFAMPARREGSSVEGFGIVYLEAAWYGVPAIAGREGGATDAVRDGETGLLCEATDPRDVARQIERLLGDGELKRRLGAAAAARARGPAQWAGALDLYLNALR